MHYKGMVRVARRDNGIRIYAPQQHGAGPTGAVARRESIDALVDMLVDSFRRAAKPASQFRVGMEHEKIGLLAADLSPLPYSGPASIEAVFELHHNVHQCQRVDGEVTSDVGVGRDVDAPAQHGLGRPRDFTDGKIRREFHHARPPKLAKIICPRRGT